MDRTLRSRARRLLGYHGGARGRWYHEHVTALARRLSIGPGDPVVWDYAASVAALFVEWRSASETLSDA